MYQTARLLIFFNLNCIEDFAQVVLLAPVFGVFELLEGFWCDKAARAQKAPVSSQCPATAAMSSGYCAYSIVSSSWLASFAPVAGVQ